MIPVEDPDSTNGRSPQGSCTGCESWLLDDARTNEYNKWLFKEVTTIFVSKNERIYTILRNYLFLPASNVSWNPVSVVE